MIDRATVTMRELFRKVRVWGGGAGLSDIWDQVLPHSRTPLWSYTPRCICSWFSEGRGMGQRVILLKTIKDILRARQIEKERRRVRGATDRRVYRETTKRERRREIDEKREKQTDKTECWRQRRRNRQLILPAATASLRQKLRGFTVPKVKTGLHDSGLGFLEGS